MAAYLNIADTDHDFLKKLNILSILRDRGENEALRLFSELEWYIHSVKDKSYDDAKAELIKDCETNLVLR